jgi:hypothetical protein
VSDVSLVCVVRELRESLSATSSFDRLGTKLDDAFGDLKYAHASLDAQKGYLGCSCTRDDDMKCDVLASSLARPGA